MRQHPNVYYLNVTSFYLFFLDLSDDFVVQNVSACMLVKHSVDSVCLKKENFTCLLVQRVKSFAGRERGI